MFAVLHIFEFAYLLLFVVGVFLLCKGEKEALTRLLIFGVVPAVFFAFFYYPLGQEDNPSYFLFLLGVGITVATWGATRFIPNAILRCLLRALVAGAALGPVAVINQEFWHRETLPLCYALLQVRSGAVNFTGVWSFAWTSVVFVYFLATFLSFDEAKGKPADEQGDNSEDDATSEEQDWNTD